MLLGLVLLVRLWPVSPPTPPRPLPPGPEHIVTIEEIVSTTQAAASLPPPPPDLPPVEVEDLEMQEVPLTLDVPFAVADPVPGPPNEGPPGEDDTPQRPAGGVSRAPQSVGPVLPPIRRDDPRVELVVEVLVEVTGQVGEARIVERFSLGRNDQRVPVPSVEPRIEDEALRLARQWRFRPAMQNGERVARAITVSMTWGAR